MKETIHKISDQLHLSLGSELGAKSFVTLPIKNRIAIVQIIPEQVPALTPVQVPIISPDQLPALSPNQVAFLSPSLSSIQVPILSPLQIPIQQAASATPAQVPSLSPRQVQALNPLQIAATSATQIPALGSIYVPILIPAQVPAISPSQISMLIPRQVPIVNPAQVPVLSTWQVCSGWCGRGYGGVQGIIPAQVPALSPAQIPSLGDGGAYQQIPAVSPAQVPILGDEEVRNISPAQIPALRPVQVPALTAQQVPAASNTQVPVTSGAQVGALSPIQIAIQQVSSTTPAQVPLLSPWQISLISPAQRSALSPAQVAIILTRTRKPSGTLSSAKSITHTLSSITSKTATIILTRSVSVTPTLSQSMTRIRSVTPARTSNSSVTASSQSFSVSKTAVVTLTHSPSHTVTRSQSITTTTSAVPTYTRSLSLTRSLTHTDTFSISISRPKTLSVSPSSDAVPTYTETVSSFTAHHTAPWPRLHTYTLTHVHAMAPSPIPVAVSVPVGVPIAVPVGIPVAVPIGVPVGIPVGVPVMVPVAVPVGIPTAAPMLKQQTYSRSHTPTAQHITPAYGFNLSLSRSYTRTSTPSIIPAPTPTNTLTSLKESAPVNVSSSISNNSSLSVQTLASNLVGLGNLSDTTIASANNTKGCVLDRDLIIQDAGDVNGDGISDVVVGKPSKTSSSTQVYVIFRQSDVCIGFNPTNLDGSNGFIVGDIPVVAGTSISLGSAGDMNDDGFSDVIIGASGALNGAGQASVIYGAPSFNKSLNVGALNGAAGFNLNGPDGYVGFGAAVKGLGDVNADGFDDIAVSTDGDPVQAFVIFGSASGKSKNPQQIVTVDTLNGTDGYKITGLIGDSQTFTTVSIGDFNDDGKNDIAIGAYMAMAKGLTNAGIVYVIFGNNLGQATFDVNAIDGINGFIINGLSAGSFLGKSIIGGDFNDDGVDDILIGAYGITPNIVLPEAGRTYVIFGRSGSMPKLFDLNSLNGRRGFIANGISSHGHLGYVVSVVDANADNICDMLVSAPNASVGSLRNTGAIYIMFGHAGYFPSIFDLRALDSNEDSGMVVRGTREDQGFGSDLSSVGSCTSSADLAISSQDGNKLYVFGQNVSKAQPVEKSGGSLDTAGLVGTIVSVLGIVLGVPPTILAVLQYRQKNHRREQKRAKKPIRPSETLAESSSAIQLESIKPQPLPEEKAEGATTTPTTGAESIATTPESSEIESEFSESESSETASSLPSVSTAEALRIQATPSSLLLRESRSQLPPYASRSELPARLGAVRIGRSAWDVSGMQKFPLRLYSPQIVGMSKHESEPPAGCVSSSSKPSAGYWYEYYEGGMNTILALRMAGYLIKVSRAITISVNTVVPPIIETNCVVLPIIYNPENARAHWVGVVVKPFKGLVTYLDPENNPIPQSVLLALSRTFPVGFSIRQKTFLPQRYSNNCGPKLIEDLAQVITGQSVDQDAAPYFHSRLLEKYLRHQSASRDIQAFLTMLDRYGIDYSTPDAFKERWFRQISLKLHPDKGGVAEDFVFAQALKEKWNRDIDLKQIVDSAIRSWQPKIYKATISIKTADAALNVFRFYQFPTSSNAVNTAASFIHLHSMYSGITSLSLAATAMTVSHAYYEGGIYAATQQAATSAVYIAAPVVLALASPSLAFAYGAALGAYTGYSVVAGVYVLYQSSGIVSHKLESLSAYRDNAQWLHNATGAEFFKAKAAEYDMAIKVVKCSSQSIESGSADSLVSYNCVAHGTNQSADVNITGQGLETPTTL